MAMVRLVICAALGLVVVGCVPKSPPAVELGGRELRPARAGINVGSLYFARETATNDLSRPADLLRLCEVRIENYPVQPVNARQVDIDLSSQVEASGGAS